MVGPPPGVGPGPGPRGRRASASECIVGPRGLRRRRGARRRPGEDPEPRPGLRAGSGRGRGLHRSGGRPDQRRLPAGGQSGRYARRSRGLGSGRRHRPAGRSVGARAVCVAPVTIGRWAMVAPDPWWSTTCPIRTRRRQPRTPHRMGRSGRSADWSDQVGRVDVPGHRRAVPSRKTDVLREAGVHDEATSAVRAVRVPMGREEIAGRLRCSRADVSSRATEVAAFEEEFAEPRRRAYLRRGQLRHECPAPRRSSPRASDPGTR